MKSETNKGGRPRKDSTEKKVHRVQVAMSDAEFAAAKRLAALLETSVSAAIATYAVPVSLREKSVDVLAGRILHVLTSAAKRTAEKSDSIRWGADGHVLIINFVGSGNAHRVLRTPWKQLYDKALENHARSYAESVVAAADGVADLDLQRAPYSAEKTQVLFSFASEASRQALYVYCEPIDWTDGSFAQPLPDVE